MNDLYGREERESVLALSQENKLIRRIFFPEYYEINE